MAKKDDQPFSFLKMNGRQPKPHTRGLTEIRGPYYSPMGKRYLADLLESAGPFVDSLKFAGGSFAIMPAKAVEELIELAHQHDVTVSTGGFIEYVLTQGTAAVDAYLAQSKKLGFDNSASHCPQGNYREVVGHSKGVVIAFRLTRPSAELLLQVKK